jgi:ATP-dependent DNA ligase
MDFRAPAIGGLDPPAGRARVERARAAERAQPLPAVTVELTEAPPPELLAEVAAAARVVQELHEQGRELRFEPDGETGRVRVEVRSLDGELIRRIPLREALDIAGGAPVD